MIIVGIVVLVGIIVGVAFAVISANREKDYENANDLYSSGSYAEAAAIYEQLGDYEGAIEDRKRIIDCLRTDYSFLPPDFIAAGNLPYCITADIVTMLLALRPAAMLLMVQKEAADRFFAKPAQKNYGPVAMVSQLYYTATLLGEVPTGAYLPPPTVTSALIRLELRPDAPRESPGSLLKFAAACLRMRRKTLYNNLTGAPDLRSVLLEMGLPEAVRGEALTPEQLLELYRKLNA